MDPLAWLGLGKSKALETPLGALHARVKSLLPEDEAVVHRYVVIVAVLLFRVAQSDGRPRKDKLDYLRGLFRHVDRMPAEGIEELCSTLSESVPRLSDDDLEVCFRELRSLCDGGERRQIMRLLASQASVNGRVSPAEHAELTRTAEALGIPDEVIEQLELDALIELETPAAPKSMPAK